MKNIRLAYVGLFAALTALWWLTDPLALNGRGFFPLRGSMVQFSGILAMGAMSIGMILALRPVFLEPWLGGMDKAYRLHKWLGISALVLATIHWLWAKGPKWAVGWGWLERPPRGPRLEESIELFRFFQSQRGLAEDIGEWAFYGAVVLILLALAKRFPYRHFHLAHRLLAPIYLLLAFHSVVLLRFRDWNEALGLALALLVAGGCISAGVSLAGRVGIRRQVVGEIEDLALHQDNRVLKVGLRLRDRWPGHGAGQFAFVTFDPQEGAHPFTISSAWRGDGRLLFLIKGLGDYTSRLPALLHKGDLVTIEGPYGRFDFDSGKPRQTWVAGGIGITPFMARMQALALAPDGKEVDLFYSTSAPDADFIARVGSLAVAAGVRLHVVVASRDGRLDAATLCERVPDWQQGDFWFCGPSAFGQTLRDDLVARGLSPQDFHQELFDMR
ncbi:ferric reductase [Azospira sp. I13]|uniref:ferredoxin reductase family protein n=1 Tax=Azospira sp. I13 TaxID=1765050 RepID=UPI000D4A9DF1|nr:ferric reductase-like transmembrane domain-containing protein [Azospira sp. I13]GBG00763.1 ferric reductase [Azospira sp. I13]